MTITKTNRAEVHQNRRPAKINLICGIGLWATLTGGCQTTGVDFGPDQPTNRLRADINVSDNVFVARSLSGEARLNCDSPGVEMPPGDCEDALHITTLDDAAPDGDW
ncbi:MAG: hypothetical protein AAFR21_03900 [Pseudomonadota bacterium]